MALISMRQLLDHAAEHGYGVPAFNVNNLEQTRAIMEAADKTNSPVIMQASAGARKYAGAPFLRAMMEAAMHEFPHLPVVVTPWRRLTNLVSRIRSRIYRRVVALSSSMWRARPCRRWPCSNGAPVGRRNRHHGTNFSD